MASLSVRKLDDNVYEQLRIRAAKHGVSMEEEARQIIYQSIAGAQRISAVFQSYFGERNGVDLELPAQQKKIFKNIGFGMWGDNPDMEDVLAYTRKIREGRHHDS